MQFKMGDRVVGLAGNLPGVVRAEFVVRDGRQWYAVEYDNGGLHLVTADKLYYGGDKREKAKVMLQEYITAKLSNDWLDELIALLK